MSDYITQKKLEDLAEPWVRQIIAKHFVGVTKITRVKPDTQDDIDGIDYYVHFGARVKHLDVKARQHDFGLADIVLETYSNVEDGTLGWTLDVTKKTDIVIFVCVDTGYYHILPFAQLSRIFARYWRLWDCKTIRQETRDNRPYRKRDVYHSEAMIVPIFTLLTHYHNFYRRQYGQRRKNGSGSGINQENHCRT